MTMNICGAPCCWGVDDPKNPYLPQWQRVLAEAGKAGYRAIELGPYGYIPADADTVSEELSKNGLSVVAAAVFEDLISEDHHRDVMEQVENICRLITKLPGLPVHEGQHHPTPYMTVMDFGHDERDLAAGHSDRAPRLSAGEWERMLDHIRDICRKAAEYGVRPVIHPHAGGYIEFEDEIEAVVNGVSYETAGLCLDTGHLYYSGMDPALWLRKYRDRLDYVHFKDVNEKIYRQVLGEKIRFFEGCGKGSMCPIGKGTLDYKGIKDALEEIGYSGYITIEQERDPRNSASALEDAAASVEYLKNAGYEI